jgi:hypothetical protein
MNSLWNYLCLKGANLFEAPNLAMKIACSSQRGSVFAQSRQHCKLLYAFWTCKYFIDNPNLLVSYIIVKSDHFAVDSSMSQINKASLTPERIAMKNTMMETQGVSLNAITQEEL